jgi:hypothetical protein
MPTFILVIPLFDTHQRQQSLVIADLLGSTVDLDRYRHSLSNSVVSREILGKLAFLSCQPSRVISPLVSTLPGFPLAHPRRLESRGNLSVRATPLAPP